PEAQDIKKVILIPEQEELDDILDSLSDTDRRRALAGIKAFNERGKGYLKLIETAKFERLWSLRINTGAKGLRVLVRAAGIEDGLSRFEIIDIDRRGNIYKNNKRIIRET